MLMMLSLVFHMTSCEALSAYTPPAEGRVFETRVGSFGAYEEVVSASDPSDVVTRWYLAPSHDAPVGDRRGYDRERRYLLGVLLVETANQSRLEFDERGFAEEVLALSPAQTARTSARYVYRASGRWESEVIEIEVSYQGCETIVTPVGVYPTAILEVSRPVHTGPPTGGRLENVKVSYRLSPTLGCPVLVNDSSGDLRLVDIH